MPYRHGPTCLPCLEGTTRSGTKHERAGPGRWPGPSPTSQWGERQARASVARVGEREGGGGGVEHAAHAPTARKKNCVSKFGKTFGCHIAFLLDKLNPTCQKENPTRSKVGTLGGAIFFRPNLKFRTGAGLIFWCATVSFFKKQAGHDRRVKQCFASKETSEI